MYASDICCLSMCSSNVSTFKNIFCIPTEILTKILLQCEVIDILSFCCTSKYSNHVIDNTYFWKQKWKTIVSSTKFILPEITDGSSPQYKKACIRYYVVSAGKECDECTFPLCYVCGSYSCEPGCYEEWKPKLVIDLGSKITRIFNTETTDIKRHLSVYRIPAKCIKDGKGEESHQSLQSHLLRVPAARACDCNVDVALPEEIFSPSNLRTYCESCDDLLDRQTKTVIENPRCFCVTCSSIHCPSAPCRNGDSRMHNFHTQCFKNELCLSMEESCDHSSQLFSPSLAMRKPTGFPFLVTTYLRDLLLKRFKKSIDPYMLRAPGSTVFICVPNSGSPPEVCRSLINFLFVEMKVGRVCLIPKALGLAKTQSASCCVVVDSGAFSTSVAVVIDEKVVAVKDVPIGGWHLSKELHNALVMRGCISPQIKMEDPSATCCTNQMKLPKKNFDGPPQVPVISFDEASVKSKCRLSPFFHSKKLILVPSQTQTVYLKRASSSNESSNNKDLIQVCLKNEFTTGPEIHFAALDLPHVISTLIEGLPYKLKRLCLSNILLTGGNGSLNELVVRLGFELRSIFPDFHGSIDVTRPFGPSDLHTVMGASVVEYNYNRQMYYSEDSKFESYCNLHENDSDQPFYLAVDGCPHFPRPHQKGDPFWLSREEYIVFGHGF